MTVKERKSSAVAHKRQETETLPGPTWKVVAYAVSGLLVAAICLAYWLGQTFATFGEAIKNNAEAIERNAAAIERNAEALERNAAAIERNAEALERNAAAIERNAEGIERLERGQERLEGLLYEIIRVLKGEGE